MIDEHVMAPFCKAIPRLSGASPVLCLDHGENNMAGIVELRVQPRRQIASPGVDWLAMSSRWRRSPFSESDREGAAGKS